MPAALIISLACLAAAASPLAAQPAAEADTSDVFYQAYLNRLMEEFRLSQIQELARNWGIVVVGTRHFRMNRSFWEQRLSLNLSLGLPAGSVQQAAAVEYQLLPRLTVRGEVGLRAARSEAWLDFIFHTEY